MLPAKLKPEDVIVHQDQREKQPWCLEPLTVEVAHLTTGDYQLAALPGYVCVERKSEPDLIVSLGAERDRFTRELERMKSFPVRALVIESSWARLEAGGWRSKITPQSVIGSLLGIQEMGISVMMCDSHERAGRYVSRLLYTCARRRYRELRSLISPE